MDDDRDVSEETYHEVQRIIEEKEPDTDPDDEPYTVSDFVDEFGLFAVVNSSSPAKLIYHCGEPMVKNGQVDIGGKFDITTHRYKCQNCDETIDAEKYYGENCDETDNAEEYYGRWPTKDEAEKMELIHQALSDEADVFDTDTEGSTSSEPDESNAG